MIELKSCPFCGGKPRVWVKAVEECKPNCRIVTRTERHRIRCTSCFAGTAWQFYEDDAIRIWNNRVEPTATASDYHPPINWCGEEAIGEVEE